MRAGEDSRGAAGAPVTLTSVATKPTIASVMLRQRRGFAIGLVILILLCGLWVPSASAHPRDIRGESVPLSPTEPESAPALSAPDELLTSLTPVVEAPPAIPWAAAAALLGVLLLSLSAARWPVETVRALLGLILVVAAAESAIHSVHHLDNPRGGASCRVLTVTQQLHGDTSPELPSGAPVEEFCSDTVSAAPHDAAQFVRRPDQGRAPPSPLA